MSPAKYAKQAIVVKWQADADRGLVERTIHDYTVWLGGCSSSSSTYEDKWHKSWIYIALKEMEKGEVKAFKGKYHVYTVSDITHWKNSGELPKCIVKGFEDMDSVVAYLKVVSD